MIGNMLREEIKQSWLRKLCGLFALPVLVGLKKRMDPDHYNGASLVGLRGVVVKSHGGTSKEGSPARWKWRNWRRGVMCPR